MNKEEKKDYDKKYYQEHKSEIKLSNHINYIKNKDVALFNAKEYYKNNRKERLNYRRNYRENHMDEIISYRENHREEINEYGRQHYIKNKIYYMWYDAKKRAKKKNIPFNITEQDIINIIPKNNKCPIMKTIFEKNTDFVMSLDRIIPKRGYVKDNIQIISHKANMMKNNATPEELLLFGKWSLKFGKQYLKNNL